MNVPGLTGSWQQRNRQLYEKMGSPQGPYVGNYQQNIMLLNEIRKNNYYKGGLPGSQPKPKAAPQTTVKQEAQKQIQDIASKVTPREKFENVVDFADYWNPDAVREEITQQVGARYNPIEKQGLRTIGEGYAGRGLYRGGQRQREQGDYSQEIGRSRTSEIGEGLSTRHTEAEDYYARQRDLYEKDPLAFKPMSFQDVVKKYRGY